MSAPLPAPGCHVIISERTRGRRTRLNVAITYGYSLYAYSNTMRSFRQSFRQHWQRDCLADGTFSLPLSLRGALCIWLDSLPEGIAVEWAQLNKEGTPDD